MGQPAREQTINDIDSDHPCPDPDRCESHETLSAFEEPLLIYKKISPELTDPIIPIDGVFALRGIDITVRLGYRPEALATSRPILPLLCESTELAINLIEKTLRKASVELAFTRWQRSRQDL